MSGEWFAPPSSNSDTILVVYPTNPYPTPCVLDGLSNTTSSENLTALLTVRCLTSESAKAFLPLGTTLTVVLLSYPIPELIITICVIFPSDTTALNFAPVPLPTTVNSGAELYSDPALAINTLSTFPPDTIGVISASFPVLNETVGLLWKFKTSDPYPVPFS